MINRLSSFSKIAILGICLCASSTIKAQTDFGMWNAVGVEKDFTKKLSSSFDLEWRLDENLGHTDVIYMSVGGQYKFAKWLKLGLSYRFSDKDAFDDAPDYKHRAMGDLSTKYDFGKFELAYRSRIQMEYKNFSTSKKGHIADWNWRNKIELKYDLGKLKPYLGTEWYYQIYDPRNEEYNQQWYRYRLYAGCDWKIDKHSTIGAYLLMQREFDMLKVSDINVIGLQYKYEIGRKKHKGKSKSNSETQEELPE